MSYHRCVTPMYDFKRVRTQSEFLQEKRTTFAFLADFSKLDFKELILDMLHFLLRKKPCILFVLDPTHQREYTAFWSNLE